MKKYTKEQAVNIFKSRIKFGNDDDCWEWIGKKDKLGYGYYKSKHFKSKRASRTAFEIFNNTAISDVLLVCHHCDNPSCVNPKHLFIGTTIDNINDKVSKGRQKGQKHGENHTLSILKEVEVLEIYNLHRRGHTNIYIGKLFNVEDSLISMIVRGKRWNYLWPEDLKEKFKNSKKITIFNKNEILNVFNLYYIHKSYTKVANLLDKAPSAIFNLINKRTYKKQLKELNL